jgi:predicted TIM-barrel fold metal-dependent hydrolase
MPDGINRARDATRGGVDSPALPAKRGRGSPVIIDSHCHAGKGDGLTGPWDTDAPLADYLVRARAAGITHSVLLPALGANYAHANAALARLIARDPTRYFGLCFVHARDDRGRVAAMVASALERDGFVGIKVHRHDAPISREICDAARRHRAPILYDVAGDVAPVELLATEYPDVAFIIPHLGSFADDWRAQLALIDQLVRHPNVYTDSAGVRRFDLLVQAVRRAGADKLLFGSDGPWLHPGVELAKIDALGHELHLAPGELHRMRAGNFLRLTLACRSRRSRASAARSGATMRAAAAARGR